MWYVLLIIAATVQRNGFWTSSPSCVRMLNLVQGLVQIAVPTLEMLLAIALPFPVMLKLAAVLQRVLLILVVNAPQHSKMLKEMKFPLQCAAAILTLLPLLNVLLETRIVARAAFVLFLATPPLNC
jgi:hypothetical protein